MQVMLHVSAGCGPRWCSHPCMGCWAVCVGSAFHGLGWGHLEGFGGLDSWNTWHLSCRWWPPRPENVRGGGWRLSAGGPSCDDLTGCMQWDFEAHMCVFGCVHGQGNQSWAGGTHADGPASLHRLLCPCAWEVSHRGGAAARGRGHWQGPATLLSWDSDSKLVWPSGPRLQKHLVPAPMRWGHLPSKASRVLIFQAFTICLSEVERNTL